MQTIYAFSYNPAIATGTNTTGTNWRMAYQQPIMLYKGTANTIRIVVYATNQKVVNLTGYGVQLQIVDRETEEHFVTRTASITTPISGVASVTFTEEDLRNLENRFYHIIAKLINPGDGSSLNLGEILYLDDNYGAFTPVTIENAWNYQPTNISTENGVQVINFRSIGETPDSYAGQANKLVKVNSSANAIDFSNISVNNTTIISSSDNFVFNFGTQLFSLTDNSTDPNHNFGDGGFISFNDDTHSNDGPRFEIWYGNVSEPADPPGQHSLDFRAAPNSYVELASHDLNSFIGVDDTGPFIQTQWQTEPTKAWRFLGDGEFRLPSIGSRITSEDTRLQITMTWNDIRFVRTDLDGSTSHQTIFDTNGDVYTDGSLLPGFFTPDPTPLHSVGSVTHPWKDLYLDNLTISNTTISPTNSNLFVDGNFVPTVDNTFDLGSPTNQWKHLYVANGSIYIGNIKLTNENGKLGITTVINPGEENEAPDPEDSDGASTITSSLVNGQHEFKLESNGTLTLDGETFTGGGGGPGIGPVLPYLELTNDPLIVQPAILGSPVMVTAAPRGINAQFTILFENTGSTMSYSISQPGTGYVVGQNYKIFHYQIGSGDASGDISFTISEVDGNGGIVGVDTVIWTGPNSDGTYTNVSIAYQPSVFDEIDTGLVLTRGLNQGIFNIEAEAQYDNNTYLSPLGTEWNADGWGDLTGLGARSYTTWRQALNNQVGNYILDAELVMHDTINDKYYKFDFTNWGENNGSFAYTRTLVTDPNYFKKTDNGEEVDIIVPNDGSTLGVAITRNNNQGIFNSLQEEGWDSDVSPAGTLWNIDGWDDLTDIEDRDYTNLFAAFGNGGLGNKIVGTECVMYVPLTDTYYAIKFLSWTQNNNGGGFSYTRKEIDLTQLNQGIKFADGSVLKSANDFNRIKSTAFGERRIEEVSGSKSVVVTPVVTTNLTTVTSRSGSNTGDIWIDTTATTIDDVLDNPANYNNAYGFEFSLNDINWYPWNYSYGSSGNERGYGVNGPSMTYNQGDTVYFRYKTGGDPVVWWDKNDLPSGGNNFRGAVIDYHAYTGESTIIGTIHIVDDDGEENIAHTEVTSGSTDGENDDLWLVQNEGTISYRRIDGEGKTAKFHWTAKVFYGSEYYD